MPQVTGGPKALNELLESTYSSCVAGGGSKESCSKISWAAAKNAGWYKDKNGEWKKKTEKNIKKRIWEGIL